MILEIKKVKRCRPREAFGTFAITGPTSALITVSTDKNRKLASYAVTLLHELLHCYIALLKANGFEVSARKEHKWIMCCEEAITILMVKILKRR